ncbi:NACHT, LRR and PYD domains-containing protein 5 [Hondaea fermentalgiana]|uniref:NACHT, LRR and PYD domains-containing protein 5 n=1 Tax=Hondaea fermentalgiana TaxID=2315210 RepID=A0A2R5GWG4_9STRA|nr:NACHT, LRR and PYD domains-containing protein 5 [Hondaea fermentalgiana]|eukprot:GBG32751.1 NACHT, LRR and PYD domains-containing protein 5 [Hondaea fermentalgiana]
MRSTLENRDGNVEQKTTRRSRKYKGSSKPRHLREKEDNDLGNDSEESTESWDDEDTSDGEADYTLGTYTDTAGRKLDLSDTESLVNLASLHLNGQGVNDPMLAQLGKALVHLPHLRVLDLSSNALADSCAGLVAQILAQRGSGLEELSLRDNRLRLAGAQTVGRALLRNETLKSLDLSENLFAEDPAAGKVLGELFGEARNVLSRLVISLRDPRNDRASMTKRGSTATFVSRIMSAHCSITALGLVQRSLPKAALVALASEGVSKAYLRVLDLSMAFIGSQGAVILSKAMIRADALMRGADVHASRYQSKLREASRESFHLLEELVLRMNGIGALGASWLAKAIASSFTLKRVNLAANELTDACAGRLARALTETEAPINELNLARNKFYRADLETTQRGAEVLCKAVKETSSLVSLGPPEHLLFSVGIKRRLLEALRHDRADARHETGVLDDKVKRSSGTIELYAMSERTQLAQLLASPTAASVDLCTFSLPPGLGTVRSLRVVWETDPPLEWRVMRERRVQAVGDPSIEVCCAGDSHACGRLVAAKKRGERQRSWMRYEVDTVEWQSGDKLILEVRPEPAEGTSSWKGCYVQSLSVQATVEGADARLTEAKGESARDEEKTDSTEEAGRCIRLLQDRSWEFESSVLIDGRNTANAFLRVHDFYVHAGVRGGELQLAWDMRIEKVGSGEPLRDRRAPNGGTIGVQWRITKNGTASTALSGDEDSARLPAGQDVEDMSYAHYRVSLRTLDVFVGDTLSLWVRFPAHVLQRMRTRQLLTLRSTYTRLLHVSAQVSNDEDMDEEDASDAVPINLAGPDPFRLDARAAYLWA